MNNPKYIYPNTEIRYYENYEIPKHNTIIHHFDQGNHDEKV